jgi:DNA-binding MarR family transcriptional regulator
MTESRCPCTALRKASRRISRLFDMAIAESGLKGTQQAILAEIARSGSIKVGTLAEKLVLDAGALAHALKPLEREGLIMQAVDKTDRRSRLVSLTPAGEAKLAETADLWKKAHDSFERAFGKEQTEALRKTLTLLVSDEFAVLFEKAQAG